MVIENIVNKFVNFMSNLFFAIIIILISFKLIDLLVNKLKKKKTFYKIDKSNQTFILSLVSIILKILILIIAVAVLGIPMSTVVAVIGSCGLALGLALQGGLSNIAGGIMIIFFKPFKVGDYIETEKVEGTVKEINIFNTVLVTIDNRVITLPNGNLSNSIITNYSYMTERQLDLEICVSYNNDIEKIKKILLDIASNNEYVIKEKDILVRLKKHGEDSLVFVYRMWVKKENYWTLKYDILENIKVTFDKNNISIPYKQLDVHIKKQV